jgi:demethylmenaquinone methyltransferase/2-methoxy-6-polyprenyl-1,4-benzoquinol methylase
MNGPLQKLFSEVADTYERVNHVLTLGLDLLWRRTAARLASAAGGTHWLDVCSGTGEMAEHLRHLAPHGAKILSMDFCVPMLSRAANKKRAEMGTFVLGDAKRLPFRDACLDLITVSFATRNINLTKEILMDEFREFLRVLKPGGRFVNLETSRPGSRIIRAFFNLYVRVAVKRVGYWLSGSRAGYAYLAATIPRFHDAEELASLMKNSGFQRVVIKRLFFMIAAIHTAWK